MGRVYPGILAFWSAGAELIKFDNFQMVFRGFGESKSLDSTRCQIAEKVAQVTMLQTWKLFEAFKKHY